MQKIDSKIVNNIFSVYNDNKTLFYVKDEKETLHDFAMSVFNELKNESTKGFSIYPYGDPEADFILEYDKMDEKEYFWVIPKEALDIAF